MVHSVYIALEFSSKEGKADPGKVAQVVISEVVSASVCIVELLVLRNCGSLYFSSCFEDAQITNISWSQQKGG